MARPTIRDIAEAVGVSPTAVSFALNSKPGISEATRARILKTAKTMGWVPNQHARALSKSRADAVGLYIARPQRSINTETFFFKFILGVESGLTEYELDLVLRSGRNVAEEVETYHRWYGQGRVDGVIVVDPRIDDPRVEVLKELRIPAVFVGHEFAGFSAITIDEGDVMHAILSHLLARGAHRVAYVSGMADLFHTAERAEALRYEAGRAGIEAVVSGGTDATEQAGFATTIRLLSAARRPDAIIFDNEVLALGGLEALRRHDLKIGQDVLVVSYEDSLISRVVTPPLTAVSRDPGLLGTKAAQILARGIDTGTTHTQAQAGGTLVIRDSTAGYVSPASARSA